MLAYIPKQEWKERREKGSITDGEQRSTNLEFYTQPKSRSNVDRETLLSYTFRKRPSPPLNSKQCLFQLHTIPQDPMHPGFPCLSGTVFSALDNPPRGAGSNSLLQLCVSYCLFWEMLWDTYLEIWTSISHSLTFISINFKCLLIENK